MLLSIQGTIKSLDSGEFKLLNSGKNVYRLAEEGGRYFLLRFGINKTGMYCHILRTYYSALAARTALNKFRYSK